MRKHAFTLIELLIVLIIIGIIAVLAVPQYEKFKEKAIDAEAYNSIGIIARAQEMYFAEHGEYVYISAAQQDWNLLGLEEPRTRYFAYSITDNTPDIPGSTPYFSICAGRIDGISYVILYDSRTRKIQKRYWTIPTIP
jgi:type IV pilus assembly protein PilA